MSKEFAEAVVVKNTESTTMVELLDEKGEVKERTVFNDDKIVEICHEALRAEKVRSRKITLHEIQEQLKYIATELGGRDA